MLVEYMVQAMVVDERRRRVLQLYRSISGVEAVGWALRSRAGWGRMCDLSGD